MFREGVFTRATVLIFGLISGAACLASPWNNPYPDDVLATNTFFSSFAERPKHLDPARSYVANEWAFISQIYEPPLQYHFLKRPYELVALTASAMPRVIRYGQSGEILSEEAAADQIAYTDYLITIQPGIHYQPHPAFSRGDRDDWTYWPLESETIDAANTLDDFPQTDTRELTADDYIYQIKRLAYIKNHSPIAGLMGEHIRGFSEFNQAAVDQAERQGNPVWLDLRDIDLSGVTRLGRYQYRIRVDGTYPQFIYWLAMNFFAPMPWEAERFFSQKGLKEKNISLHWYPVGTGPYMLTENNPNLRMVLSRNPNFHGETYPSIGDETDKGSGLLDDAGQQLPFIEKAVYVLEKEAIPRWNKFLQGYYDNSGIASDSFDQAVQFANSGQPELTQTMHDMGIQLNTAVETSIFYTGFNMKDSVVGGGSERARLLRRAISIAIDMEEYIAIFRNGRGLTAQGPLPPGIFGHKEGLDGHNPYVYQVTEKDRLVRRPVEQAKALLEQAGYPDGRDPKTGGPLILYYDTAATGPESKSLLDWYSKQFKKVGIQLVVRTSDYNRFQEKMLKGTAQIYSWGWNADYPDPENFLFLLYGPNGKVDFQGENASNYQNIEFDRLFTQMKNLPNGAYRQQVVDQMIEILRHDAPWIWGFFPKAFGLHHAWYGNAKTHLMANNTLKYKRVRPELRHEKVEAWNQPILWPVWLFGLILVLTLIPAIVHFRQRERESAR